MNQNKFRVLFIYPNFPLSNMLLPAGVSILSAVLKENGIETKLFDTTLYVDGKETFDDIRESFNQLKKSDFDEIWDKVVLNTIKKRNPKAVQYIDKFYTNTFRVVDEEDVAKKLTVFLEECFGDEEVNKKNKNIILKSLKDTAIEYETSLIKLL